MKDNSVRCFVVDDEPHSHEVLEKFIRRITQLSLIGKCDNAIDALFQVQTLLPDILFLDIEMPQMSGIELLQALSPNSWLNVIIVSAHPQYAIKGYDYAVVDYLLKPISFERFIRAVSRVTAKFPNNLPIPLIASESVNLHQAVEVELKKDSILIKEDKRFIKVSVSEISFIEGMKDYMRIHLQNHKIITHMTMMKITSMLPSDKFIRVNRSYIVRIESINSIDGNIITTAEGYKIPIGKTYKTIVWHLLKKRLM